MAHLKLNNKYIQSSIHNNYKLVFFGVVLVSYFAWMDIGLFVHLQRWQPPPISESMGGSSSTSQLLPPNSGKTSSEDDVVRDAIYELGGGGTTHKNLSNSNKIGGKKQRAVLAKYNHADPFTVYKPLSVKLIMIDHVTHYVHDILARFIEDTLHFTSVFPWITANLVSYTGLFMALIGSRLIISDNPCYVRLGAVLFESRNLLDSLDGVVYRSKLRQFEHRQRMRVEQLSAAAADGSGTQPQIGVYQSNYGSSGYNTDYFCDGFGGLFFVLAVFVKFLRHLPSKNTSAKLLISVDDRGDAAHAQDEEAALDASHSSYIYQKLEQQDKSGHSHELQVQRSNSSTSDLDDADNDLDVEAQHSYAKLNNSTSTTYANELVGNEFEQQQQQQQRTSGANGSSSSALRHVSSRRVKMIVISFGLRLLFTGLLWDHFVHKYHDLLMNLSDNPSTRRLQAQSFKSIGMWLIMWFWRIGNACAILEHLSISAFFNKLWEYISYSYFIGWIYLISLALITQLHYSTLRDMILNSQ